MGATIFISYRRGEDTASAGRLYDRVSRSFRRQLFMDLDSIDPGEDFVAILESQVAACDVVLALIGRGWLAATDEAGRRRLDNPEDFVRIEVGSGLAQGKRVIPVLIDAVPMPRADELPEDLRPLARRNAVRISHERFEADAQRLIRALRKVLPRAAARPPDPAGRPHPQAGEVSATDALPPAKHALRQAGEVGLDHPPTASKPAPSPVGRPEAPSPARRERGGVRVDGVYIAADPRELPDLAVFKDRDEAWCPEMVIVPAGAFIMGSPKHEGGRFDDEGPQHRVTIGSRFALGRYPVTAGAYRKFVEATGRRHAGGIGVWTGLDWEQPDAEGWHDPGSAHTDGHPVVGVNWRDAVAYCEWLAKETGKPYRLPSEAEWEYACRAGTTTRYVWGETITEKDANFDNRVGKTTEVGTYPPNPWGLYDMHGNVWEWLEDVGHADYRGAPADGSAWTHGEGRLSSRTRVIRGGSWDNNPRSLRSAIRGRDQPNYRGNNQGFRVARTLD